MGWRGLFLLEIYVPYKDPEQKKARDKAYNQRPEVIARRNELRAKPARKAVARRWYLKSIYGLEAHDYAEILTRQQGVCAICGKSNSGKRDWHVDHDHVSGKVRGVLCNPCNLMLGLAKDNPDVLRKAASYLDDAIIREYDAV